MTKLFEPLQVGACKLDHRLALAPLTRYRADDDWVPRELVKEATQISPSLIGCDNAPGIWNNTQIAAWEEIVDEVHARGCFIWCQLWVQGRTAKEPVVSRLGNKLKSSSAVPVTPESPVPEELTEDEILGVIGDYAQAARNAIAAGFDGVELHGGNGYLPDQFLQDTCNKRNDRWGGSMESRARFYLEVVKAIAAAVGSHRTACRVSPWGTFNSMGMDNIREQMLCLIEKLKPMGIAFLDIIESRLDNHGTDCGNGQDVSYLVQAWADTSPVFLSGGFTAENARQTVDEKYKDFRVVLLFGRYWTSNPDLVFRIRENVAMVKYDRSTFYTPKIRKGFVDWPMSLEFMASVQGAKTQKSVASISVHEVDSTPVS